MTVSKKKKLLLVSILVTTLSLVFLVLSAQSILAYMKDIKAHNICSTELITT